MMQNKSFNEHYYKIKKVPLSQYYSMSEENLFGISSNSRHKPGCTNNEDGFSLDFSVVMMKRDCTIHVAKTKMLISCLVKAQLICAFDFAISKAGFLMPRLK